MRDNESTAKGETADEARERRHSDSHGGGRVSGLLTSPPDIHPHGRYLDGGSTEPKGGH
ncbi:hypothetical protein ACIPLC_36605 [Kitasatospora sp. NPDC086801]|uniref:hypothetical protein n=1 Tax=Kitasatospora sp. NPDC086801 TaxID=3364066 RepID=UPI003805C8A8